MQAGVWHYAFPGKLSSACVCSCNIMLFAFACHTCALCVTHVLSSNRQSEKYGFSAHASASCTHARMSVSNIALPARGTFRRHLSSLLFAQRAFASVRVSVDRSAIRACAQINRHSCTTGGGAVIVSQFNNGVRQNFTA